MKEDIHVNYLVYETALARAERFNKRTMALCVIIFLSLILTNMAWIVHEAKYDRVYTSIEAEQEGDSNIVGGSIDYGSSESKDHD